jgi:hypothetical protein
MSDMQMQAYAQPDPYARPDSYAQQDQPLQRAQQQQPAQQPTLPARRPFVPQQEPSAATERRLAAPPRREVRDGAALAVVVAFKVVRIMLLWIALYFVDRAYQSAYVQRVLVDGKDPRCDLWTLVLAALAIEAVVLGLLLGLLMLVKARFKSDDNTFVLDGALMRRLLVGYASSTAVVATLGAALGVAVQDARNFRYKEDGLRGIRALSVMLLLVSTVTIAV